MKLFARGRGRGEFALLACVLGGGIAGIPNAVRAADSLVPTSCAGLGEEGFWRRLRARPGPAEECGLLVTVRQRLQRREKLSESEGRRLRDLSGTGGAFGLAARRLLALELAARGRWEAVVDALDALVAEGTSLTPEESLAAARGFGEVGRFLESRSAYRAFLAEAGPGREPFGVMLELAAVDLLCEDGGEAARAWLQAARAPRHPTFALYAAALLEVLAVRNDPVGYRPPTTDEALSMLALFDEDAVSPLADANVPRFPSAVRALIGAVLAEGIDRQLANRRYEELFEERPSLVGAYGPRLRRGPR